MKGFKSLNTTEMGIDVNDLKILINSGFQYLIKTCHKWAKDHPLVSCVLIFFYLLYIFFPSLFSILFYTFPLVICSAILLGGSRFKSDKHNQNIKCIKTEDDQRSASNSASASVSTSASASGCSNRRPYLQSQMSRRTFGKDKKNIDIGKIEDQPQEENKDNKDNFESFSKNDDAIECNSSIVSMSEGSKQVEISTSLDSSPDKCDSKMKQNSRSASRSDIESQEESDEDEQQEETNKVVQWTENDQKNLMDLGSSEIERNRRLESLIAKRRARKLLSMQPRRNLDYLGDYFACDHQHMDSVGSLMVARAIGNAEHQPGSAPSLLKRNPFDLPYDPQEEKPILTGGSFEEEFFARATEQKDLFGEMKKDSSPSESSSLGETNPFGEMKKDSFMSQSLPSFFSKSRANDRPGCSQFGRVSDAEEIVQENPEETSLQGDDKTSYQEESTQEVQCHDQANSLPLPEEESHKLEADTSTQNLELKTDIVEPTESKEEEELGVVHNEEVNVSQADSEAMVNENENQSTQDQLSVKEDQLARDQLSVKEEQLTQDQLSAKEDQLTQDQLSVKEDHNDGNESSSSSSCETNINASKNEAFRNSVKKVLTCLVKRKGLTGKEKVTLSSSDLLYDSSPTTSIPTKMEERSYYTSKNRHKPTLSIASDMQVEVSDAGSPKSTAFDPNSPTDRESLVYDGDVERDANSGDEDLWGTSPHPMKIGDSGTKFKMPDIIEEGNNTRPDIETAHNASDPPTVLRTEEEVEQAPDRGATSSLSPRSILPEENRKELIDQKSTNGDIVQPRSSDSSSSESLDSQMQTKSENVAEYLANLPPSESSSNVLEDPWQSHVREASAEEITLQDENNPIFEMDEDKEDSKERKELEASQECSYQSSGTSQSEAPQEMSLASNEQGELKKEHVDEVPNIAEQNQHFEVESSPIEKDVTETNSGFREPEFNEKEVIFDSYSTHSEEDSTNPSRSAEACTEFEEGVTSGKQVVGEVSQDEGEVNQVKGEVKVVAPNNPIIHEASTSMKDTGEAGQHGADQQEVDEINKEDNVSLPED